MAGWGPNGRFGSGELTPSQGLLRHVPMKDSATTSGVQALFPRTRCLVHLSIESYMALTLPSPTGRPVGWIAPPRPIPAQDAERPKPCCVWPWPCRQ